LASRNCNNAAVDAAAERIRQQWRRRPKIAVVLGTGLDSLGDAIEREFEIKFSDLPGFPIPTALAHKGVIICGCIGSVPVIMFSGRCHLYEAYSASRITMPVQLAARLGVANLILSNASGGLNPVYRTGDVMLIVDHINLMGADAQHSLETVHSEQRITFRARRVYDPRLLDIATVHAARAGLFVQRGIYAAVKGPNYETRAEYRMLRRLGADVVGMSTVPEAICAAELGLRVLGLSIVTNVARPDLPARVDAQEVVDVAAQTEPQLQTMITHLIPEL